MAEKPASEWEDVIRDYDLVGATIQTPFEVVKDPQAWENDFFTEIEHPNGVTIKMLQIPIQFSLTPGKVSSVAPELGQNTEEVLLELGYGWEEIASFKNEGVIL